MNRRNSLLSKSIKLQHHYLSVPELAIMMASSICIGFGVITAVIMRNTIFWDVMPYRLVEAYQHSSETLVKFYHTTQHYIPEDSTLKFCQIYNLTLFPKCSCSPSLILPTGLFPIGFSTNSILIFCSPQHYTV
jgi:hypothetical protein